MLNPNDLKIGMCIRHITPYPGEGERMVVGVRRNEVDAIVCGSSKLKKGMKVTLPFFLVAKYYEIVPDSEAGLDVSPFAVDGESSEGEYIVPTPGSLLDDKLKKVISEHFAGDDKKCNCSERGVVHYRGKTLVCMQCGGIIGDVASIDLHSPFCPPSPGESPPIIKFDTMPTGMEFCECGDHAHFDEDGECYECGLFPRPHEMDTFEVGELQTFRQRFSEAMDELKEKTEEMAEALRNIIDGPDDGTSFNGRDSVEWVFQWGRTETFVEFDLMHWFLFPSLSVNFSERQLEFGWLVLRVQIDWGKDDFF